MNLATTLLLTLPLAPSAAVDDPHWTQDAAIDAMAKGLVDGSNLPGVIAALVEYGKPTRVGAFGLRKLGKKEPMTPGDLVHIGSDTKAMTAVLLGRLVDQGVLRWDLTVGDAFGKDAKKIHEDFRPATLAELMRHTAGLPANPDNWFAHGKGKVDKRRRKFALEALAEEPITAPGYVHLYSNLSVMIAGAMAESVTGETWEELMETHVFGPLGMESAGFGFPGKKGKLDQPWGHQEMDGTLTPLQWDNDPALGPAGTVHLTMGDWGKFIQVFLDGNAPTASADEDEKPFLSEESLAEIKTPGKDDYAMGWIIVEGGGTTALSHAGSNNMWFANTWVYPARNVAFLVATNAMDDGVPDAVEPVFGKLMDLCVAEAKAPK